jgi:hypothetical protein
MRRIRANAEEKIKELQGQSEASVEKQVEGRIAEVLQVEKKRQAREGELCIVNPEVPNDWPPDNESLGGYLDSHYCLTSIIALLNELTSLDAGRSLVRFARDVSQNSTWADEAKEIVRELRRIGEGLNPFFAAEPLHNIVGTKDWSNTTSVNGGLRDYIKRLEGACATLANHRSQWRAGYDRDLLSKILLLYDGELSRAMSLYRARATGDGPTPGRLRDILGGP